MIASSSVSNSSHFSNMFRCIEYKSNNHCRNRTEADLSPCVHVTIIPGNISKQTVLCTGKLNQDEYIAHVKWCDFLRPPPPSNLCSYPKLSSQGCLCMDGIISNDIFI